jgi:putative transposase
MHDELRNRGVRISRKRAARLVRQAGLSGPLVRRRGTTAPNRLWAADLTKIPTWDGVLNLAVVIDC